MTGSDHRLTLDDIDIAIIQLLQQDGRRAFSSIAGELNLAASTVQQRATRLIDSGILTIKAIVHPVDLGQPVIAMVAIKVDGTFLRGVAARLRDLPEVRWVVICAGSYDILIEVVCQSNEDLLTLLSDKLAGIDGVRDTVTFPYLDVVKRAQEWMLPNDALMP